jgi:hypothetical protein
MLLIHITDGVHAIGSCVEPVGLLALYIPTPFVRDGVKQTQSLAPSS